MKELLAQVELLNQQLSNIHQQISDKLAPFRVNDYNYVNGDIKVGIKHGCDDNDWTAWDNKRNSAEGGYSCSIPWQLAIWQMLHGEFITEAPYEDPDNNGGNCDGYLLEDID